MWRNVFLLFVMLGLVIQPVVVSAADKKPAKRVVHKYKASKAKVSRVSKAQVKKVNYAPGGVEDDNNSNIAILQLASSKALIVNQVTGEKIYSKDEDELAPIASLTKLMTAMVVLDAKLPLDEVITISQDDVDTLKNTHSRLRVGTELTRAELLQLAIMASENRAASALGRTYPGGLPAFLNAMHAKAAMLGMTNTHFSDATGLNSANVSTAADLVKMVQAAYEYPEIRNVSTAPSHRVPVFGSSKPINYVNTNALVRKSDWIIGLSKTGFINEAGRCLVMQAEIAGQPMIIVLLNSWGKYSRIGDANRIRRWIESSSSFKNMS
ncbi:MAG TPA: D-alanyl-D-alanine endopeptidase [Methylophilaceae bacterium]|nr:D-alanyl-D-alanine endopeptidase [Methylophilaceae bacterium]